MARQSPFSSTTRNSWRWRDRLHLALRNVRDYLADVPFRATSAVSVALDGMLDRTQSDTVGILTYHRTVPWPRGLPEPWHNVQPRQFRRQMEGLLARGFQFWPLRKVLEYRDQSRTLDPNVVVLTFDDGYQSFYRYAFPILRQLQIPATLFLPTAFLDGREPFPFDDWGVRFRATAPAVTYRPVTTRQCREMAESGLVELAAHTHTHRDFCDRPAEFRRDLERSLQILEQKFGLPDATFAFPFGCPHQGFADRSLQQAARKAGVLCGLTTEAKTVDVSTDPVGWGRFPVFSWDSAVTLSAKLHGWYSWAPVMRRRVAGVMRRLRPRLPRSRSTPAEETGGLTWLTTDRSARAKAY